MLLGFGAATWLCASRDKFIGWSHEQRQKNLHLVVSNARFLILPWVCSDNLASKVLGLAARQLAEDWQLRYSYSPLLSAVAGNLCRNRSLQWHLLSSCKLESNRQNARAR
ncbi:Druantia anti-phage system protein DruA [Propionivibrio sp.]|uniref:Druantia anti-phage system protein DruA n=1 Tax=Propionivibrio sp. TaxID=2212460 RepID=UPI003BF3FD6C